MAKVTVSETVDAPLADLWASWDDFGDIYRFNPNLKTSFLLDGSATTGLGARRQCNLADGKNHIQERIIEYTPQKKLVIDIYHGTLPLKSALATFDFESLGPGKSRVTMTMDFTPKFGPLGLLMVPMMKPQFRRMLGALLKANAGYVERGEEVRVAA